MRTALATLAALAVGVAALWWGTDGLRAFTAESVRRLSVAEQPVLIPDADLIGVEGNRHKMSDFRGKVLLVEFIYTTCPTICQQMGEAFQQVLAAVKTHKLDTEVGLLSVSFDIAADRPADLASYGALHGADNAVWKIVKPASGADLRRLLGVFGVTVIADPVFKFQHNAAIHVVDRRGRLVRIVDIDAKAARRAMLAEVARR